MISFRIGSTQSASFVILVFTSPFAMLIPASIPQAVNLSPIASR
jgi:hypothetical protein